MNAAHKPAETGPAAVRPTSMRRERLAPADRRRLILRGAVTYFAEVGFEGGTRELARRLGVTQPLIYRYFPSKEDLIRAVYEDVYLTQWNPAWEAMLTRADRPLRERLIEFYIGYTDVIFKPEWLRIYLFAGLRGLDINRWWMTFVERHVLHPIAAAIRHEHGLPGIDAVPVTATELELYWMIQGGIFYYGLRRDVYHRPPGVPLNAFIESSIDVMLHGLPPVVARLLRDGAPGG